MSVNPHVAQEREFKLEQLFYSRTDLRGGIQSGNDVFREVSGYPWQDLIGAPHKVIRHPDMPKGAFCLIWSRLKEGKATSAYVKNRAIDGRYYWVLANMTPIDGGYFSVRLKPTTDLLKTVEGIYAELLALEKDGDLSPEDGAAWLTDNIRGLGFKDYESFAGAALNREVVSRAAAMDLSSTQELTRYQEIAKSVDRVGENIAQVEETFRTIRLVPSNMRIIATRLEPTGGPISTIAVNYAIMAREMEHWVQTFLKSEDSGFTQMSQATNQALFQTAAATLQAEVAANMHSDTEEREGHDPELEKATLDRLVERYRAEALAALSRLAASAARMERDQAEMKRYVTGLASTRTLCRVENARLDENGGSLEGIVESLDRFQNVIDAELTKMSDEIRKIQNQIDTLRPRDNWRERSRDMAPRPAA